MTLALLWSLGAHADACDAFGDPDRVVVGGAPVAESSGLAASRTRAGVFFTHEDSGNAPELHAIDVAEGRYLGSHPVRGALLVDWEDLAAGPCPTDGEACLYVGDIGDNDAIRSTITIYVVPEPAAGEDTRAVETWAATYPDGPRDAETLLVHPCTGDVYVVTKEPDGAAAVYRLPVDRRGTLVLEPVASLQLDDDTSVTGGQWDPDGDQLVLRTRERLWVWATSPDDPDAHWELPPVEVGEVDEVQGEGVAFALDGSLVTSDEGAPLTLQVLPCAAPAPADAVCAYTPVGGCACASTDAPSAGWAAVAVVALLRRRPRTRQETP